MADNVTRVNAGMQRMASINEPDTYWDIQTENPHAGECWAAMEQAVSEIQAAVKSRDRDRCVYC